MIWGGWIDNVELVKSGVWKTHWSSFKLNYIHQVIHCTINMMYKIKRIVTTILILKLRLFLINEQINIFKDKIKFLEFKILTFFIRVSYFTYHLISYFTFILRLSRDSFLLLLFLLNFLVNYLLLNSRIEEYCKKYQFINNLIFLLIINYIVNFSKISIIYY